MSNFNANRPLQNLGAGDARALGLTMLGAEAMGEYLRTLKFGKHVMKKTAMRGTAEQFPIIGRAQAQIHTPGTMIQGDQIQTGQRLISLEDLIISPTFIANIDEVLKSWEARGPYARAIGEVLARRYDEDIFRTAVNAARSQSTIPGAQGHGDGVVETNAGFDNDGLAIFDGIFNASVAMKQQDVPVEGMACFLDPVRYALLVRSDRAIDRDLNPSDNGSLAKGIVRYVNNVMVYESNSVAATDETSNLELPALRREDYSNVRGVIYHKDAVGALIAKDIQVQATGQDTEVTHQGTLVVGKMFYGMGVLRPEGAAVLQVPTT